MSHYRSNLRDLRFNLFEVFGLGEQLGSGRFAELDTETVEHMLAEVERLSVGPIAASYAEADRTPPVYDPRTFSVAMPEGFRRSYQAWMDAEWWRLDMPAEAGGVVAPRALWWALIELVQGAQAPVYMYGGGPGFGGLLHRMGTPEQQRIAEIMIDRRWGATMVLTEPDAGSDVGAGRTRALPQADGTWHIEGVKRFITSGEHDLSENIMHFVLARPVDTPGAGGPGTKGLSMFLVPKFHFDHGSGELGERNGVYATNVEKKMGLKVSSTCELTFGQHGTPAVGWLVGEVHDGIAQMFKVIESARMQVGVKAIATLSTGYLNALDYARQRVQGPDLTQAADKTAPRVTIDRHPDVRRILMLQKAYAEGLRAVYLYTAGWLDRDHAQGSNVNDLLLPIVKGVGSERSYEMLALSLQTLGGSGYLQDYPMEQYIRDTKIDTLYEGTTAIQGMDFFFRKIARDRRVALDLLLGEMTDFCDATESNADLKLECESLREGIDDVRGMVDTMLGWLKDSGGDPSEVYKIGQNSTRLLMSVGDLLIGWLLTRQAAVALDALAGSPSADDTGFYQGKLAVARFFARTVLPELTARRRVLQQTDNALMEIPDGAF
ncbi:acyl-CoA dehydrogenase [Catellatospora bangladeshensis]|uniref:Broad-specificity linear acyl-CoA dehydrogenase FadE5 n=1 Tax=Catellatospora bangladeshensis TaxID=310355 RepID=A0A8J3JZ61_9ACTN|nr:acyl-CoA dehydrogenase [Catellatospora bangladeshensis]GIF86404.1 acyl-CoA dehydrogenase [Catellatospora bangladeshensis]